MSISQEESERYGRLLREHVEPARLRSHMSLREAARRAGMSESTWRQLVAGGVHQNGTRINRTARRDQLLSMAFAVGTLDEVGRLLGASERELEEVRERLPVINLAEQEILGSRYLTPDEKLHLVEVLTKLRERG